MRNLNLKIPTNLVAVLAVSISLCGCSDDRDSQIDSTGANAVDARESGQTPDQVESSGSSAAAAFQLTVKAVGDDPANVEVAVVAADPGIWLRTGTGDAAAWQAALVFHRVADSEEEVSEPKTPQPIIGRFNIEGDRLLFRPAFPLLAGEKYRARFDSSRIASLGDDAFQALSAVYEVPAVTVTNPKVTMIYPSGNILPANHLKFYILFSEPMQRDGIFEYFRLIDLATNKPVPRPFRHIELWAADHKQLTLWFHPGRQKRGVNLNVEVGPVLKPDGEYRLEIDGSWKSEAGRELGETISRTFRTGQPDDHQPEPASWILSGPRAGSTDVLTCDFHEPLDWALLHSELSVVDAAGKPVAGYVELGYGELSWEFHAEKKWQPGKYRVSVGGLLEDLAGNSVERPFEVDISKSVEKPAAKDVFLEFEVFAAEP